MNTAKKFILTAVLPLIVSAGTSPLLGGSPKLKEISGDRFIIDLRYNTDDNFLKANVYAKFGLDRCYLRSELAEKLLGLSAALAGHKLKLVLFDCYRPLEVQREMWKINSDPKFVADPQKGSNHNRGTAVDAGLAAENGALLLFPTLFDDFTSQASHSFVCPKGEEKACANRELLKKLMTDAGLEPLDSEWWHYQLPGAKKYSLIEGSLPDPGVKASPRAVADSTKPVVGLLYTSSQAEAWPGTDILINYTSAIEENGGSVVILAQTLEPGETAARLASIDALLVPGGDDVSPDLYGEKTDPLTETVDRDFDLYELAAVKKAVSRGIPILGICKGHQLLAVYAGGALYQDLPTQLKSKVTHRIREEGTSLPCYHEVKLRKGSAMARLFKGRRYKVNSYHHQGVKTAGGIFRAVAWSDDGLIEAMEAGRIITTQFHPEKERRADPAFNAVFEYFLSLAGKKR